MHFSFYKMSIKKTLWDKLLIQIIFKRAMFHFDLMFREILRCILVTFHYDLFFFSAFLILFYLIYISTFLSSGH